ncbi:MAG: hypothetical protein V9G12_09150 [Microthrixaceae bacterium]
MPLGVLVEAGCGGHQHVGGRFDEPGGLLVDAGEPLEEQCRPQKTPCRDHTRGDLGGAGVVMLDPDEPDEVGDRRPEADPAPEAATEPTYPRLDDLEVRGPGLGRDRGRRGRSQGLVREPGTDATFLGGGECDRGSSVDDQEGTDLVEHLR